MLKACKSYLSQSSSNHFVGFAALPLNALYKYYWTRTSCIWHRYIPKFTFFLLNFLTSNFTVAETLGVRRSLVYLTHPVFLENFVLRRPFNHASVASCSHLQLLQSFSHQTTRFKTQNHTWKFCRTPGVQQSYPSSSLWYQIVVLNPL